MRRRTASAVARGVALAAPEARTGLPVKEATVSGARHEGVLDLIHAEHQEIVALFELVTQLTDADDRRSAFGELKSAFEIHSAAEAETLYAVLRELEGGGELVGRATEEHERLDDAFDDVSAADPNEAAWTDMVAELRERVERHVAQEETVLFDFTRDRLEQSRLLELERAMLGVKADLQGLGYEAVQ